MTRSRGCIFTAILVVLFAAPLSGEAKEERPPLQYILLNRKAVAYRPGQEVISRENFMETKKALPEATGSRIRIGLGFIFSYFRASEETVMESLQHVLKLSEETDTPVYLQLDGEQWWDARPDLWNWWDPSLPGFNPENKKNVEWHSWSPEDALKISWRNWGRQLRVRPAPNLMSPVYRKECHKQMERLVPVILAWWKGLPAEKKDLFVGLKVGWESSVGVNAWYYPNGNALLNEPPVNDPTTGLTASQLPGRGAMTIGYAAVKTAGIRKKGELTEGDLAEVARRHLEDLARVASKLGVPREKLFTHGVGWNDGELLYQAPVNKYSCPGWSFYKHAADPKQDMAVKKALKRSTAPYWAVTEWLLQGPQTEERWKNALDNVLADQRCRFLCIYNWEAIRDNEPALQAIRNTISR